MNLRLLLATVTILFLRLRIWLALREAKATKRLDWLSPERRDLLQFLTPQRIENERREDPQRFEGLRSIRVMPNGNRYYCVVLMTPGRSGEVAATCFLHLTTEALTKNGAIATGKLASMLLGVPLELRREHPLEVDQPTSSRRPQRASQCTHASARPFFFLYDLIL